MALTIRRAEGVSLGLAFDNDKSGRMLIVREVLCGGAIENLNRQLTDSPTKANNVILIGDAILCVNASKDCETMRLECRSSRLLNISVAR